MKIKKRIKNEQYILHYQPIYNPRNSQIIGFEALLRLIDKNKNIIPPSQFISEIEKNNMLMYLSISIIEKVVQDYQRILYYECISEKDFYISINISLKEIVNDCFINKAIEIISNAKLKDNSICFEIIERVRINDLDKISKNIHKLKSAGIKIAIDDFGVEYSNVDILQTLDFDTIKVDKNFIDGINKDRIKEEFILFISKIASLKNKAVVLEGIEDLEQHLSIKKIKNDSLYVQGYYYNKPMSIDEICTI